MRESRTPGSVQGERGDPFPCRDNGTKNPASKINRLRVPKVSLNMRWGKRLRVRMSPHPRHPMEHRGEVSSAWFPCVALARGAD